MNKLETTAALVKRVLTEKPATRNDDNLLYFEVCQECNPTVAYFPFGTVLPYAKEYDLPSYKSVERARRKIQRAYPELASDKQIKAARTEEEAKYKAFAREGVV